MRRLISQKIIHKASEERVYIRIFSLVLLCVFISIALIACDIEKLNKLQYGSLSLGVSNPRSTTVKPNKTDTSVIKYKLYGKLNDDVTYESSDYFTEASTTVDNLLVGDWTFYVIGFNDKDLAIARSEDKIVQIRVSPKASATFDLSYYEDGEGTLELLYKFPAENNVIEKVVITLENVDSTKPNPEPITMVKPSEVNEDGFYHFSSSNAIATGTYRLTAKTYKGEKALNTIAIQSVYIFKDLKSSSIKTLKGTTAIPVFTPSESVITSETDITITSSDSNAYFYYTTDKTKDPITEGTLYTSPIRVSKNTTIYAIALSDGLYASEVVEKEYRIKAANPTANAITVVYDEPTVVKFTSLTSGSSLYYTTDGTTPSKSNGSLYTADGILISKNTTLKIIAINSEYDNSDVITYDYKIRTATPTSTVPEDFYGTKQYVELNAAEGAEIYYTLNGDTPNRTSTRYNGETIEIANTTTIKAIAYCDGYEESNVFSATISIVHLSAPIFSVSSGTYNTVQSLELTSTENADIYYTTDGTDPTTSSNRYTSPITIDRSMTVKAIAAKTTFDNTAVVSETYTIESNASFRINNPKSLNALTINIPEEWKTATSIVPGVAQTLTATLSDGTVADEYIWYLDGKKVSTWPNLYLGTRPKINIYLKPGFRTITCLAKVGDEEYTDKFSTIVSPNATVGSSGPFYLVGEIGPAGGYIFYDKGYYSDGWRYLEAAPNNIEVDGSNGFFIFGYYRTSIDSGNRYVNGTTTYDTSDCTSTDIGTGKINTEKHVNAMGSSAYSSPKVSGAKVDNYAAKLCFNYTYGGYDDWFLPSKDELNEMYKALKCEGGSNHGLYCPDRSHSATSTEETRNSFGNFFYCSSSESKDNASSVYIQYFDFGAQSVYDRGSNYNLKVRAVRAF